MSLVNKVLPTGILKSMYVKTQSECNIEYIFHVHRHTGVQKFYTYVTFYLLHDGKISFYTDHKNLVLYMCDLRKLKPQHVNHPHSNNVIWTK